MKSTAVFLLCLFAGGAAQASDNLLLTGTEWSRLGSYSYVGTLSALGGGSFGNGWVMRQWVDRLTYEYDGAQPRIHAESYGYSPALGYQVPVGSSHMGIYGAVRIAHTELNPDDVSNADRGTHARFSIQMDMSTSFGKVAENQVIAQADIGNGGYYARDRLLFNFLGHYTAGPEIAVKGNEQYRAWQAGAAFGGISLGPRTTLLLHGGISDQHNLSSEGYVSLELAINL